MNALSSPPPPPPPLPTPAVLADVLSAFRNASSSASSSCRCRTCRLACHRGDDHDDDDDRSFDIDPPPPPPTTMIGEGEDEDDVVAQRLRLLGDLLGTLRRWNDATRRGGGRVDDRSCSVSSSSPPPPSSSSTGRRSTRHFEHADEAPRAAVAAADRAGAVDIATAERDRGNDRAVAVTSGRRRSESRGGGPGPVPPPPPHGGAGGGDEHHRDLSLALSLAEETVNLIIVVVEENNDDDDDEYAVVREEGGASGSGGGGGGGGEGVVSACCFRLPTQHSSSSSEEEDEEGDNGDDDDDDIEGSNRQHGSVDEHGATMSGGIETFKSDESFIGRSVECGESEEATGTLLLPFPPRADRRTAPSRRPDAEDDDFPEEEADDDEGVSSLGPRRVISPSSRKFRQRMEGISERDDSPSITPPRKRRRADDDDEQPASKRNEQRDDAFAADNRRPWDGRSAAPVASPPTCGVGTCPMSDDVTREDSSLEPEESHGRSVECGETEVPGTLLPPPPARTLSPGRPRSAGDDFGYYRERHFPDADDDDPSTIGPRRISASPNRSRRREGGTEREHSPLGPPAEKRYRVDDEPASMQHRRDAITTDIRPWNVHSAPIMSPLTCDVKTYPIAGPSDGITRRDSLRSFGKPIQSAATRNLYIAYDVLDRVEIGALEMMHHRGYFRVVSDGIRGVTLVPGKVESPFPAILVTHGVDKPGGMTTCYRSCSYLKAVALGALVVDARWLVDSQHAGILLDCEKYEILRDLESHSSLTAAQKVGGDALDSFMPLSSGRSSMTLSHKFDGVTLGLLRDHAIGPPVESKERRESQLNSQLHLETRQLTTQEIRSIVKFLGGRIITNELKYSDVLLVDDWMTFNQITKALRRNLDLGSVSRWSIRKCQIGELNDFTEEGRLAGNCGGWSHARIPIIRSKWLEDSICRNSLGCLERYCWGILCL